MAYPVQADPAGFDNLTWPTFDTLIWPTLSCSPITLLREPQCIVDPEVAVL
jgi:hypothetical protein